MKSDWWHIVAALPLYFPLALIAILLVGINPYIFQIFLVLLYPVALYQDAKYVRQNSSNWRPGKIRYGLLGVLVVLSAGILSLLVSPYYLYKRRSHLP
jgi:hypothetical protein